MQFRNLIDNSRIFWLAKATVLTLLSLSSTVSADDVYDVGISVVDITPDFPIRLNGFGNRRQESEGVSQRIFAKALSISQHGSSPLVLVTLDSLGIRSTMVDEVAARLQKSHQLPRQNLAITFTHSHCTPKVNGACDNIFSEAIPEDHQQHIDRYTKELTDHITAAATLALNDSKPSHLEWAVGTVGFAKNRRIVGGPKDHDLPMLIVRDSETKKPRAFYVSYACHCVTLSFNQISGDWAGYAAAMIERQVPGTVALVSIGAGSDQNPVSGVTGDKVQVAEGQGVEIATEVERLLRGDLKRITGAPASVLNQIALPLNPPPSRQDLADQTGKGRPTDRYNATTQLARLDRGESLLTQIDYPVQTWTFGDSFCMTFLAGEVCVDYSLRLKQEFDRERFWLNTYSNDFCCYIPSERLVAEGGYGGGAEVPYFALPATLRAGLEQRIVDEVHRQVPKSFRVPEGTQGIPPKSPEDSLRCMQTHENLKVVLVAAEPSVSDPVAIDFGPDGRLWVAEMNDYGQGVYETFPQNGRIRWLKDANGDGTFEQAQTFVDGLRFPTDVKVWRDGILICDAPDILFAQDSDNDGRADSVLKLFSGFEVRNAQARVNSLRFGLDNWIYGSCGLFGGKITSHLTGQTIDCSNRDFRMNPDSGVIEPVSGRTQQGRCRNDWGDWFGCSNGTLLRFIPADDRYQKRNPFALPATMPVLTTDSASHKLIPPKDLVTFALSGAPGKATSACGLGIYRDVVLGSEYTSDAFTCEPVHQSVHRIDLSSGPSGFVGQRGSGEESREFLSSTDRWFRPVQARTGPDGALWIVDMYRYVIEHSRWIPQSTLAELDVYAGRGRGRIYRVVPQDVANTSGVESNTSALIPNLSALSNQELVLQLNSTNGTVRDLVHQLLLWRAAVDVVPNVRRIVKTATTPATRIQALAVLDGLKQLTVADLDVALKAEDPEVLRFAAQLSESFLDDSPDLRTTVLALAAHKSLPVRRQVALSAGASSSDAAALTIVRLLDEQPANKYVHSAALNSISSANVERVLATYTALPVSRQVAATLQQVVLLAIHLGNTTTVGQALQSLPPVERLPTGVAADAWVAAVNALDVRSADDSFRTQLSGADSIRQLFLNALAAANGDSADEAELLAALKLLGRKFGPLSNSVLQEDDQQSLASSSRLRAVARLISARRSSAIQLAAVQAIAAVGAPESASVLVSAYRSSGADIRVAILDVLLSVKDGPVALLSAIEAGRIRPEVLDATRRSQLLANTTDDARALAERVLGAVSNSSRAAVVKDMAPALELPGSVSQGRTVFRKRCSACHRLQDEGHVVGPDLKALTNRDPQWLLTTMLDPNKDVDARYFSWTALTQDGRTASGMIVDESATSIRLRESGGKEHIILRNEIEEFQTSQRSLMPEGLERDMTAQDFRDVIAYLISVESPFKKLAGNLPHVVKPDSKGYLSLTAAAAEIRGTEITFEAPFANIGYWHHQNDSVRWKIQIPESGDFDIYVNAACANASAGHRFRIEGCPQPIISKVSGTGGWDRYRQHLVGTASLQAGAHVITVRAEGTIEGALFDLREIRLVPAGAAPMFVTTDLIETPLPRYPPEIAPFLLDESEPQERRQQAIDQRPGMGPAIITLLVADLKPGDADEEYRRIPWIWRTAIAVGRRNDGGEIRDVLEVSIPKHGQPLRDWQAVVIGGGLINGVSQQGVWPKKRIDEILTGLPTKQADWQSARESAMTMAGNEDVKMGTRYDALRMLALTNEETAVSQLRGYLTKTTPRELQMGAVSGLADIDSSVVIQPLADALSWLEGRNRRLAIEGLLRTDQRAATLASLIKVGTLTVSETERQELRQHAIDAIRTRAATILSPITPD